jgi:putative membrane protein
MKFLFTNLILGVSALGFIGCAPAATNTNRAVLNSNTNTAATNSNMSSSMNKGVSSGDQEFLNKALLNGLVELQTSGHVITKAQNDEVRAFAQKMISDHSKANKELKELGRERSAEMVSGTGIEEQKEMAELLKLSGAAFDKEYVKRMVAAHEMDVAVYQKQADGGNDAGLKKFAAETLPTLKMHLEMIKDIQGKLK